MRTSTCSLISFPGSRAVLSVLTSHANVHTCVASQAEDNESFFTAFLRGTVGVLSLDMTEMVSHGGGKSTSERTHTANSKPDNVGDDEMEKPLLSDSQWQRLCQILDEQVG